MAWLSKEEIRNLEQHASTLELRMEALLKEIDALRQLETDLNAKLHSALAEKDKLVSECNVISNERNKLADELSSSIGSVQKLKTEIESLKKERDKIAEGKDALSKEYTDLKTQGEQQAKDLNGAKKANQDLDVSLTKLKTECEQFKNQIASLAADLNVAKEQLKAQTQEQAKKAQETQQALDAAASQVKRITQERDQATQERDQAKADASAQTKVDSEKLKTDLANANKELGKLKAAKEDALQENELLLLQLMQAQEELVEYYEEKQRFEKLFGAYKARWDRLEKRYPNYMDFEGIELVGFDAVSEIPSITWRVKDFAQAGIAFDAFLFQTVMQDGLPGLAVVTDPDHVAEVDSALVPKLLQGNAKQRDNFIGFTNTEFRQIRAAATVLAQLESAGWKDFELPAQFDLSFWRPILKQLVTQILSLPAVLRYDQVKLKRELINPDYEHLWLEFHGVNYGAITLRKFEARLGAALVQMDGFSKFPKFEIPLIDGKTKPFESWYAESHDDHGAKLELRFSIEKNAFDIAVWNKLDDNDKAFLLRLIYAFPQALQRLQAQHAAIHRPWDTWVDFAKSALGVLEVNRKATQTAAAAEKAISAQQPQAPEKPKLVQPLKPPSAKPTSGVKVIQISGNTAKQTKVAPAKAVKTPAPAKTVAKKVAPKTTAKAAKPAAKQKKK